MRESLTIQQFDGQHNEQIIRLISHIQQNEFKLPITPEDQPDLSDIPGFYQQGSGNFWLARLETRTVGTAALVDIGGRQAALRKMFVQKEFRGGEYGVASALLRNLLAWAREERLEDIFLGTTTAFMAAHRFYEKNGFSRIEKSALPPSFPLMGVDSIFYHLKLS
jgi:GNAT superfamily N-acetyltransferase